MHLLLLASCFYLLLVTSSKALVTRSDALVTSSLLFPINKGVKMITPGPTGFGACVQKRNVPKTTVRQANVGVPAVQKQGERMVKEFYGSRRVQLASSFFKQPSSSNSSRFTFIPPPLALLVWGSSVKSKALHKNYSQANQALSVFLHTKKQMIFCLADLPLIAMADLSVRLPPHRL